MFEHYTEKARRTIFYARYEASQFGSPQIEAEHLLLGLLREDKALSNRLLRYPGSTESIRKKIEARTTVHEPISTSVDLPLTHECKRALAYATEESTSMGHRMVGTEHLLLGLLREETSFAAELLREQGVTLAAMREDLLKHGPSTPSAETIRARPSLPFGLPVPTVRAADLAASEAFYTKLGFRNIYGQGTDPVRLLSGNSGLLVLYKASLGDKLLCFTTSKLGPLIRQVASGDLTLEEPLSVFAGSSYNLLLRDPDGNLVLVVSLEASTLQPGNFGADSATS